MAPMAPQVYREWKELHRRAVLGEMLSPSDQDAYEAGCRELDAEETLDGNLARMRELREQIDTAVRMQRQLRGKDAELNARISALEARLDTRTRQLLGISN